MYILGVYDIIGRVLHIVYGIQAMFLLYFYMFSKLLIIIIHTCVYRLLLLFKAIWSRPVHMTESIPAHMGTPHLIQGVDQHT